MAYGITFRVSGAYALFTRPEMKVERVSYDVITPSAARGILEAVYWKPSIRWVIDSILVLNPIQFTNIRRNEVSEKASTESAIQIMGGAKKLIYISTTENRQQRASMVLKDIDYIIQAHFDRMGSYEAEDTDEKHYNMALRRLRKGQHFHKPCLGTREFPAKVELVEKTSQLPESSLKGELDLGWMLYDLDYSNNRDIKPIFFQAKLQSGFMDLTKVEVRQ